MPEPLGEDLAGDVEIALEVVEAVDPPSAAASRMMEFSAEYEIEGTDGVVSFTDLFEGGPS